MNLFGAMIVWSSQQRCKICISCLQSANLHWEVWTDSCKLSDGLNFLVHFWVSGLLGRHSFRSFCINALPSQEVWPHFFFVCVCVGGSQESEMCYLNHLENYPKQMNKTKKKTSSMKKCSVLSSHTMSNVLGCIPEKTKSTQPYAQRSSEKGRLWVTPRRNGGDTQQEMANTVDRDCVCSDGNGHGAFRRANIMKQSFKLRTLIL